MRRARAAQLPLRAGDQPSRLAKARNRGADALIVDLEDAVAPAAKDEARAAAAEWLAAQASGGPQLWLRINPGRPGPTSMP